MYQLNSAVYWTSFGSTSDTWMGVQCVKWEIPNSLTYDVRLFQIEV